jgi:hypothetical protein
MINVQFFQHELSLQQGHAANHVVISTGRQVWNDLKDPGSTHPAWMHGRLFETCGVLNRGPVLNGWTPL